MALTERSIMPCSNIANIEIAPHKTSKHLQKNAGNVLPGTEKETKVWRQLAGQKRESVEMARRRSRHILGPQPKISDTVKSSSEATIHLKGNYLAVNEHGKCVPYNIKSVTIPKSLSQMTKPCPKSKCAPV